MSLPLPSEQGRPLVIAHRGASGHLPENTLPAYRLAIEQRADMIEIDLHTTRDGQVVVTHDEDLEGLGGVGEIAESDFQTVRSLDAGDGERVPSLEEVLDGFGAEIPFNLEIKRARSGRYSGLEEASLEAIDRRGLRSRTLFSCFWDDVLEELRRQAPDSRLATLVSPRHAAGAVERALAVGAEAVNPHVLVADEELVRRAHGEGLAVYVYTVDDEDSMRRLIDRGVDGLFTNHPDRMRSIVDGS